MADEVYEGRNAEILESIINDTEYTDPPQSRIEELLLELKEVIEQGGGGSASLSDLIEDVTGYPLNDYASMSLYSKDLNTITKSGFYNAMTCTNAPFDYMTLTVIGYYLQGYTVQIACDVTTGEVKKRNNVNGTWSAWSSISGGSAYSETSLYSTANPDLSLNATFNLSDDIANYNTFIFKIKTGYNPIYVYVPTSEILTGDEFIVYGNLGGNQYQTLKKTADNQLTSPASGSSNWGILEIKGI